MLNIGKEIMINSERSEESGLLNKFGVCHKTWADIPSDDLVDLAKTWWG